MKDAIMTAGRGLSLKEVDYDNKSKQFKDTGEEITMENLKSDKYKVTATRFSPYGTTVMIQDDKGNVRRYRMPAGINTTNEQNRDRAMSAANKWQQVVSTGQYTDARGNIHYATPDEITYAQQQYAQAIQQAYLYHSQLGVQNKIKEQEFNPYGY
jgi:ATP:corrinoid adenosyltransferase